MTTTTTERLRTASVNCRCEIAGCGAALAEYEVISHLVLNHDFGGDDFPVRANVVDEDGGLM